MQASVRKPDSAVACGASLNGTHGGFFERAAIGGDRPSDQSKETRMLRYAAIFFVIAIVAAVFGFGGIAAGAAEIARILFFIFLVVFLVTLIMGLIKK